MKFGQQLKANEIDEWRRKYIDYRLLKKLIKKAAAQETPIVSPRPTADQPGDADISDDEESAVEELRLPDPALPHKDPTLPHRRSAATVRSTASSKSRRRDLSNPASAETEHSSSGTEAPLTRKNIKDSPVNLPSPMSFKKSLKRAPSLGSPSARISKWRYTPGLPLPDLMKNLSEPERNFFDQLDKEYTKVRDFYEEREEMAVARFKILREQLEQLEEHKQKILEKKTSLPGTGLRRRKPLPKADGNTTATQHANFLHQAAAKLSLRPEEYQDARRSLKLAFVEYYKFLGFIKSYRLLNLTGISKATKKFEKVTKIPSQKQYLAKVNESHFSRSTTIDELMDEVETLFGRSFEQGSRKKAIERLRVQGRKETHHYSTFRSGIMLGAAVPAVIDGLYKMLQADTKARLPYWPALLQIFGAEMLPTLFVCLAWLNLDVWHKARINYTLIFEWDLRTVQDYRVFAEVPAFLLLMLAYAFWLSVSVHSISPTAWPLAWLVLAVIIMFNPIDIMHRTSRYWLLRSLGRVFTGGILRVEFRDFFLGDQLASLYYTIYTSAFLVCTYHHNWPADVNTRCSPNGHWYSAGFASIPYILRLTQSLRRFSDSDGQPIHLLNAGKYGASILQFVLYFAWRINGSKHSTKFATWIVFAAINSMYSLAWDILIDWGLLKRNSKHRLLRNELAYRDHRWTYYAVIVLNTLLRFSWFIYLPGAEKPSAQLRGFIVAFVEMLRRWIWNFYRLDNEHVGNVDGFRVTRDIPLPFVIADSDPQMIQARQEDEEEPTLISRFKVFAGNVKQHGPSHIWRTVCEKIKPQLAGHSQAELEEEAENKKEFQRKTRRTLGDDESSTEPSDEESGRDGGMVG